MFFSVLVFLSFALWVLLLVAPWQFWRNREILEADPSEKTPRKGVLEGITVLIPARNESKTLGHTLEALIRQDPHHELQILVIDDHSEDDTGAVVLTCNHPQLNVIKSKPLPRGWSGKLWALEQGFREAQSALILALDADIQLKDGTIAALRAKLEEENRDAISLMAEPPLKTFWEKLLMPTFIWFFRMLYPFHLANNPGSRVSAAAGGCILIRRQALQSIGGYAEIRGSIIDDCALAQALKAQGNSIWLGLTHSAKSIRPYSGLNEIWNMVARNAYSQLRNNPLFLLLTSGLLLILFWIPLFGLVGGSNPTLRLISALTCGLMFTMKIPVLKFYGLPATWALGLPINAALFLGMTWTSALRHHRGERLRWRGRTLKAGHF